MVYPGNSDESHPELFNCKAMPVQSSIKKSGQLPEATIRQFFEQGYVVVEKFFEPEELEAAKRDIEKIVDTLAQKLYKAKKIPSLHEECGFNERVIKLEEDFPGVTMLILKETAAPKAFQDIWANERLLNVMEQILGPDICGHPVWNIRSKIPQNEQTVVPWHQDVGYMDNDSYKVLQPAAWIPLLDANAENGCLEFAERGHKTGRIAEHTCCWGNTLYVMIEEEEMKNKLEIDIEKDFKVCPVPYGGMVLFNNIIPHRSLPNVSKDIRWSLDFRWQRPTEPIGFYNCKDGILLRSSKDPNIKIDWETFNKVDRHVEMKKATVDTSESTKEDEFDATVPGPWMKKWKIVHHNRHTQKQQEIDAKA